MKLFAFIMSLLILTLSCVPCADEAYASNDNKAKTGLSKPTHEDCNDHADDCSPFCTCNCCAGFTVNASSPQITGHITIAITRHSKHLPQSISNISLPVWQPPQLS